MPGPFSAKSLEPRTLGRRGSTTLVAFVSDSLITQMLSAPKFRDLGHFGASTRVDWLGVKSRGPEKLVFLFGLARNSEGGVGP